MADIVDTATRSRMMAGIKGANTKPEIQLRRALHARGLRFRLHARHLPGRPDIILPKWRAAIEVRGCFWHRHQGCSFTTTPTTRTEFWTEKFAGNVARDERNLDALLNLGWRVALVWECTLRRGHVDAAAEEIILWLSSGDPFLELPSLAE